MSAYTVARPTVQQSRWRCPLLPKAPPSVCLHCWRERGGGGEGAPPSVFCFSPPSGLGGQRTRVVAVVVKQCKGCKNAGSKYRYALLRWRREGRGQVIRSVAKRGRGFLCAVFSHFCCTRICSILSLPCRECLSSPLHSGWNSARKDEKGGKGMWMEEEKYHKG